MGDVPAAYPFNSYGVLAYIRLPENDSHSPANTTPGHICIGETDISRDGGRKGRKGRKGKKQYATYTTPPQPALCKAQWKEQNLPRNERRESLLKG